MQTLEIKVQMNEHGIEKLEFDTEKLVSLMKSGEEIKLAAQKVEEISENGNNFFVFVPKGCCYHIEDEDDEWYYERG
jgi:hypothetical protein